MNKNQITLCFVTLERASFLAQALNSVADMPNILVYDNGTESNLNKNLIKATALKNKARYIRTDKNEGLMRAWNKCIEESSTDWVACMPDDVVFREGWFKDLQDVLEERTWVKIVFGNNYDCIIVKKDAIKKPFWNENYKQYPSMEDYDKHLELTEELGFSPYCWPGDHVRGNDRLKRLEVAEKAKNNYLSSDNFTFWFTYEGFQPLCHEIPHPKNAAAYAKKDPKIETGQEYFNKVWQQCQENDPGALLNIDCLWYRRR